MRTEHFTEFFYEMIDALNYNVLKRLPKTLKARFRKTVKRILSARVEMVALKDEFGFVGSIEEFKVLIGTWTLAWKESLDAPIIPIIVCVYWTLAPLVALFFLVFNQLEVHTSSWCGPSAKI